MKTHKHAISLKTVTDACDLCHAKDICVSSLLDPESLKHFKDIVHHKSPMERGERLFMAGDSIHSIFILHSGSVKSYLESNAGDNQITGFHLPGDVVGIHGLEKKCHADTVEALETSCVCEIRFSNFDEVGDTFPALQKKLARNILLQMDHDQEMMMILGKMSAERRVAYFLLDMAKRLKGHGLSSSRINLSMTRHDIANYLGLAVETVSRLLTRMQKSEVIRVDRRSVEIINRELLENIYNRSDDDNNSRLVKG